MKFISAILLLLLLNTETNDAQVWKQVESLSGGTISLINANIDGTLFCSSNNRIFVSENYGEIWKEYHAGHYINQAITSFGFVSDSLWLIGAGELMYRTSNKGQTWELIDSLSLDNIRCFVGIGGDTILAGTDRNLLVSSDKGITWSVSASWKIGAPYIIRTEKRIYINSYIGIYESDYSLKTWKKTTFGKDGPEINGLTASLANSIFVYTPAQNKIFYTTNGGDLWLYTSFTSPGTISGNPFVISGNMHYLLSRENGLFRTKDMGTTWEKTENGMLTQAVKSIFCYTNKIIFFSDGLRIYSSRDSGNNWTQSNKGISALNINYPALYGNEIYVATSNNGFFKGKTGSSQWIQSGFETDTMDVITLAIKNSDTIIAGTHFYGVMFSLDGGKTFQKRNDGIAHTSYPNIYTLALDPLNENAVYAGTLGMYKLKGEIWEPANDDSLMHTDVYDIKFTKSAGGIYLATDNGIYYTGDYGSSWKRLALHNKLITTILIDGDEMFAGSWSPDGIFYSNDGGINWETRNNGLPQFTMVKGLIIDKDGKIYAATLNNGIYVSSDRGKNWKAINDGLPTGEMGTIAVSRDGEIYAATKGWGLYKFEPATDAGNNNEVKPDSYIYPNPSMDYIEFDINIKEQELCNEPVRIYNSVSLYFIVSSSAVSFQGGKVRVGTGELPAGVYLISICGKVYKFVKL